MGNLESLITTRRRLEEARALQPGDRKLFRQLSKVLEQLGAWPDLLNHINQGIELWPGDTGLLISRSRIQTYLGDFQAARTGYLAILEQDAGHVGAIFSLVMLGNGDDAGGLERVDALLADPGIESMGRIRLCYARARLLEQARRFKEAFDMFREANSLRAAAGGMDITAKQRGARAVIKDLSPQVVERFSGRGNESERPVFIVGMPRSGTSLTEQVLGSHPDVYAAGEQLFWGDILTKLITGAPKGHSSMVEAIHNANPLAWKNAGSDYLQHMNQINSSSSRITDKLPANFGLLPFVRLIFPRSRIIHLRRDPLATITSCIRTPFGDPSLAFSAEDWARFYGIYQALMNQWRPVLGAQMLEVDYETLVTDFPAQARRIIAFLGLQWDDACLSPERNPSAVKTASAAQIRRSVHGKSIDAWRRYEIQLEALRPCIEESYLSMMNA